MKTEKQTLNIDMHFSPENLDAAMLLLTSGIGQIESKPGCEACSVARDAVDATQIHYSERWASEEAFNRHACSEEFRRILVAVDLCSEEPEVLVGNLTSCAGLSCLQGLVQRK